MIEFDRFNEFADFCCMTATQNEQKYTKQKRIQDLTNELRKKVLHEVVNSLNYNVTNNLNG